MNIRRNFKRIATFFWNQRANFLEPLFWKKVGRILYQRFRVWEKVSPQTFQENLQRLEKRPWNLHLELANVCNANCIFCAYQHQTRPKVFMNQELFEKALNDYCAIGGGDLALTVVVGDPLMDSMFLERVKAARSRPVIGEIHTITNGIDLRKFDISELVRSGLTHITISTAPWDRDLYVKIYRTSKAKYDYMREGVTQLLQENQKAGCPMEITISFRSNLPLQQVLQMPDYQVIRHLPHKFDFNTDYDSWTGQIKQEDLLEGMSLRPRAVPEKEPCFWLYDGPVVFTNGDVGMCGCRDFDANSELIIGNIAQEDLHTLWVSDKVKALRQKFHRNDPPDICKKCTTYANLDFYRTHEGTERTLDIQQRLQNSQSSAPSYK